MCGITCRSFPDRRSDLLAPHIDDEPVAGLARGAGLVTGGPRERLGVSRQTVNAVETERYEPSLSLAFKIAWLFGQQIEKIFEGSKESDV
jgi:putative transcriptional regulator